jgi:hypothetical protein
MRAFLEAYPHGSNRASLAPPAEDHVDPVVLAANASYGHPVPAGASYVVFSFDGDVFVRFGVAGVAASVPGASATSGGGSVLNPSQRRLPDGITHIALIATEARKGSLSFYA